MTSFSDQFETVDWTWFYLPGAGYNQRAARAARGEFGVYAFRQGGDVLYVGMSYTGRLWKTALRHFQGLKSFSEIGEWTHGAPEDVDVKIWVTDTPDQAWKLEAYLQRTLKPTEIERLSSYGYEEDDEEAVPF